MSIQFEITFAAQNGPLPHSDQLDEELESASRDLDLVFPFFLICKKWFDSVMNDNIANM